MGHPEAGAGQICQQVSWDLQRREQTQTVHGDSLDRMSSCDFSGKREGKGWVWFWILVLPSSTSVSTWPSAGGTRSGFLPVTRGSLCLP